MKKTTKISSFVLLLFFSSTFCYADQPDVDKDEFYTGQILYFDIDKLSFAVPSGFTVTRIGDDVNWDPFDAVYAIKTLSKQYMVYLTLSHQIDNLGDLRPLVVRDVVCLGKQVFINHACETDDDHFIGVFEGERLVALYRQDYEDHKFIPADSIQSVRCCPDLSSEDFYYPERFNEYGLEK